MTNLNWFTTLGAATAIVAGLAPVEATSEDRAALVGDWSGVYYCGQGATRMTLRVQSTDTVVRALYAFYAHETNPRVPSGCYELSGLYDAATGAIEFEPAGWLRRPDGFFPVGLSGDVDLEAGTIDGAVLGFSCTGFSLTRVDEEERVDAICTAPD